MFKKWDPNIIVFVFAKNFHQYILVHVFVQIVDPNKFVFVFGPENCICPTLKEINYSLVRPLIFAQKKATYLTKQI